MTISKRLGDVGEAAIMADVLKRGYKVAIPFGDDWRYDLIVLRNDKLERLQCKYVASLGQIAKVKCRSTNGRIDYKYSEDDIDWRAVYDSSTDTCYYIPSALLGTGRASMWLRLQPTKNGQKKGVLWAKDFLAF